MASGPSSRGIRVLVVGQSALRRQSLSRTLREAGGFEIVGAVAGEPDAAERAASLRPALIALDLELDGSGTTAAVRAISERSGAPIVVLAASDQVRSQHARELLHAGATAVTARPPAPGDPAFLRQRRQLLTVLRGAGQARLAHPVPTAPAAPGAARREHGRPSAPDNARGPVPSRRSRRVALIAVAASTGGPAALRKVLAHLPARHPPVLIVQHIGDGFADSLAQWLAASLPLSSVRIARQGEALHRGDILIAPSNIHLGVNDRGQVELTDGPPVANHKPSANVLFASVAVAYGGRSLAVVLTGMGRDGADGLVRLRQAGGHTIAQDAASSVVNGMPEAAAAAGGIAEVLPVDQIGRAIAERVEAGEGATGQDAADGAA